jgi:hypothetical protein
MFFILFSKSLSDPWTPLYDYDYGNSTGFSRMSTMVMDDTRSQRPDLGQKENDDVKATGHNGDVASLANQQQHESGPASFEISDESVAEEGEKKAKDEQVAVNGIKSV